MKINNDSSIAKLNKDVQDNKSQLASITQLGTTNEFITVGSELIDDTGWTSTGWTGNFAMGFTHTVGQSTPLQRTVTITAGRRYQVQLRLTNTCYLDGGNGTSDFTISLGGSATFATYEVASASKLYTFEIS